MKSEVWLVSQIEKIATALIAVNGDPAFRAGVLALCMALDVRPLISEADLRWQGQIEAASRGEQ